MAHLVKNKIGYNIVIPKGCECKDVAMGSYDNQVILVTPPEMVGIDLGCLKIKEFTAVDKCIANLIRELWSKGIITTGCCCGHNIANGYIGIIL